MHRFYSTPEKCQGDSFQLEDREAYHALHVLRLKRGDEIVVLDGAGGESTCEIATTTRNAVSLRVTKRNSVPAPPCSIALLVAVPKGKTIENIIQKSVELGVRQIVPLLTERVITRLDGHDREHKRELWQQAAVEAIKQCGAAWLPVIGTPVEIERFLERKEKFDLSLVGSLQTERRHPKEVFREFEKANAYLPRNVAVWIGPEGDFTPAELQAIRSSGAHPITLGNLTLRVETAAVYCLSVLNYELNS